MASGKSSQCTISRTHHCRACRYHSCICTVVRSVLAVLEQILDTLTSEYLIKTTMCCVDQLNPQQTAVTRAPNAFFLAQLWKTQT